MKTPFLYLFRESPEEMARLSPAELQEDMARWMAWTEALAQRGNLEDGQPLVAEGHVVGPTFERMTDGPYPDGNEVVSGYLMVRAEDLDHATELAKECPILHYETGSVEIREIIKLPNPSND
ncbi:MAG: hypothetical protein JNN12_02320 [Bacteroidetes Order II. Incertae sedis bacterium]|nr:hypothetical protein [Bacteroidetes Order II. bacterium]